MTSGKSWSASDLDPQTRSMAEEAARRAGMSLDDWIRQVVLQTVAEDEVAPEPDYEEGGAQDDSYAADNLARLGEKVRAMSPHAGRVRNEEEERELDEIVRRVSHELHDEDDADALEADPEGEEPEEAGYGDGDGYSETLRDIEARHADARRRAVAEAWEADDDAGHEEDREEEGDEPQPRPARTGRGADIQILRAARRTDRAADAPPPKAEVVRARFRRSVDGDTLSAAIADISHRQSFLAGQPATAEDPVPPALAALRDDVGALAERFAAFTARSLEDRTALDGASLRVEKAALASQASMATIAAMIGDVRGGLDALAAQRAAASDVSDIANIVAGLAELRSKVEGLEKTGRQSAESLRRLEARVETMARVDPVALVRGVEARIDRLAGQIESTIRAPRAGAFDDIRAEIAAVRLELATRGSKGVDAIEKRIRELMEHVAATSQGRADDSRHLAALEARVEGLAADLARTTPRVTALDQIEAHIARLKESFVEGREESVAAARQAAEAAVRELGAAAADGDRALVSELRRDLDDIRRLIASSERPNLVDDDMVKATLSAVAERIDSLPRDPAPPPSEPEEAVAAALAAPSPVSRPRRDLGLVREVAGSVAPSDRSTAERRADFIAAARRAVQAAMADAGEAGDDAPAMAVAAAGPSPFARIGQSIRARRRPLLLAAAALVLAIGALQMFSRPVANADAEPLTSGQSVVIGEGAPDDGVPIPVSGDRAGATRSVGGAVYVADTAPVSNVGPESLRAAAASGDPTAAYEVGNLYADGRGTLRDLGQAAAWYQRAADAGVVPAIYRLGSLYERGQGVPKNLGRAMTLYEQAARAGNPGAMYNLAVLLNAGAAGEADPARALELFEAAAAYGVKDSQYNLGVIYSRGLGVRPDLQEAYKWFALAAAGGDADAAVQRDQIGASLDAGRLSAARATVAAFAPRTPPAGASDTVAAGADAGGTPVAFASRQELVQTVQQLLARRGYDPGPPDGMEGPRTVLAVRAFQRSVGLPGTGVIDEALVARLSSGTG